MKRTTVVVIGGGQAGLAMSACLSARGIDHVVLERGRIAERWRSERWDSLRLLTPRWQSRLPGFRYEGPDPDGFMTMPEVIGFFEGYAGRSAVPIETKTAVRSVSPAASGYRVETSRGVWQAGSVVIATGHCDVPLVPEAARELTPDVHQLVPTRYRNPSRLPPGGVLIVGASASGVQIADELSSAGRAVTLAVGRHTRLPRRYRGKDVLFWLDRMGVLDQSFDSVRDIAASRRQPSMQLVGRPDNATLDLAALAAAGVRLTGRVVGAAGSRVAFADDLTMTTALADAKLWRLLGDVDRFLERSGIGAVFPRTELPEPTRLPSAPAGIDLRAEGIRTVIWATGFTQRYPWLHVPVLDEHGALRHRGGIVIGAPGLYAMGLRFMRRRKSSFIDGVANDARDLADHIAARLRRKRAA